MARVPRYAPSDLWKDPTLDPISGILHGKGMVPTPKMYERERNAS